MAETPKTPGKSPPPADSILALVAWTSHGVPAAWLAAHFVPACAEVSEWLVHEEPPADFNALLSEGAAYDLLLLGADDADGDSLARRVEAAAAAHPLALVLACAAETGAKEEAALLRAGAADVFVKAPAKKALREAVERAARRALARRQHFEAEKLRVISQLAISVNHEINNPLTGLMGTTELILLENRETLGEKMRQDLKTIVAQCNRIREITTRLRGLNHLRTVNYGAHDKMLDLGGPLKTPPAKTAPAPAAGTMFPIPRLLIVDDNPLIIDLVKRLFDKQYAMDAAGGAVDGLALAASNDYDLILIDLILPEMNGLELFRAIRAGKPAQRALLTTAHSGDERVAAAIAEGALGCVNKPFKLEELTEALERALGG